MDLQHDVTFFHPNPDITGPVRQLIWETGHSDKPYLVGAVSYLLNGYTTEGDPVVFWDSTAVKFDWVWLRVVRLCDNLDEAWTTFPAEKDVAPVRSGDGYETVRDTVWTASGYMSSLTPDDFRPEDYTEVLEQGLHKLLP